ncbi:hypothetical protein FRC19_006860 [Serendipita sp. 401]|nr:hypothetical protein FRC16_004053 [Serendipita sp. 398]KAG8807103.1 hypothetical protein FRC19_006860 [Serendipita sp. 401]KAG8846475.1 hypothetical protein FRC20_002981 [Serendipita sp. 405]
MMMISLLRRCLATSLFFFPNFFYVGSYDRIHTPLLVQNASSHQTHHTFCCSPSFWESHVRLTTPAVSTSTSPTFVSSFVSLSLPLFVCSNQQQRQQSVITFFTPTHTHIPTPFVR